MRICVLTGNYTRAGETFVYEPLAWLAAAGHEVALLARRARALPEERARRMPDRVVGAPSPAAALLRAFARAPLATAAGLQRGWPQRRARGFELAQGLRAAALPEVRDADALFAHFGPTGLQFLSTAFLARRPYAVYFHGYDVGRVLTETPRAYESLFGCGASLLTNCEFQRSRLVAAGAPSERVRIVPLGVDPQVAGSARTPEGPPRVVTLARLVPKKGLDDSLRAFARLGTASAEWHYDIVGDGPLREALARLAAEEKIARVHFHGFLARDAALRVLRGASVFALASRTGEDGSTEGTSVALLEAAALGIPIVATRHAGIPEILPAQAASEGFLVAEGDVQAFGDALARLAREPALRADWGRACADHVRARHSAAAHVEALTDALANHARVPQVEGRVGTRAADATPRRLRIGVVANEFFDHAGGGRIGGFGWAAAEVARCFREDPTLGADVFFLTGARGVQGGVETRVHDTPLLLQSEDYAARIRELAPDLLLLIDYRRGYRRALEALPATPFIVWSRDPWDAGDRAKVQTLRIPGAADEVPSGYGRGDHTSFREVVADATRRKRRWLLATTTPYLAAKVEDAYGVAPPRVHALPNPLPAGAAPRRAARPTVLWLGRLDAVKRPWLCVEIARRMPHVEFQMLGEAYIDGPLRWQPKDLPPNVKLAGHLEGAEKDEALARAWLLLSTAIHEGLAVSFLEALAAEVPIVACQDPEYVVSRFGRCVGRCDGSGMQAVPAFVESVGALLADTEERQRLGRAGRNWVAEHHSRARFLEAFRGLAAELGVAWPEPVIQGASEHGAPRPRDPSP